MSKDKTGFKFSYGADPEFFVVDKAEGKVVPSCGKFGGEKKSPIFLCPDGGYLEDGATVEFNVTPCSSLTEVKSKIGNLLTVFMNQHPQYSIYSDSSYKFPPQVIKENPKASIIGCDADFWAWGLRDLPSISQFKGWRFAGGHVHVGIDPWPKGLEKSTLIKYLDVMVLCPLLSTFDPKRYQFYGLPGLFRNTSYGVEWRSPDNGWCNPENKKGVNFVSRFLDATKILEDFFRKSNLRDPGAFLNELVLQFLDNRAVNSYLSTKAIVKRSPIGWKGYDAEYLRERLSRLVVSSL